MPIEERAFRFFLHDITIFMARSYEIGFGLLLCTEHSV